jgi:hypothetical protein
MTSLETEIIALNGLSESKVRSHLNGLEWLHLDKAALPETSRAEFRFWNVTQGCKDYRVMLNCCTCQHRCKI